MIDLLFRNATLQNKPGYRDVAVDQGKVIASAEKLDFSARQEIDLGGRLLIPGFVESHLHLDIALMNDMERPGRSHWMSSPSEMNQAVMECRKAFTRETIEQRAGEALELASQQGVVAMRAQCHVDLEVGLNHLEALLCLREKYAHRITLQIVAFPQLGLLSAPGTLDLIREAIRMGADVMGCASDLEPKTPGGKNFRAHIDAALNLASELDVDLDMHADLSIPISIEIDDLEAVYAARQAIRLGYQGRITAGHLCSLDSASPEVAGEAIEQIKSAGMNVISQPDLYRLGRADLYHVRRGLTRVRQLLEAGVNVAFASNNVRDAYRPLGNFDLLEEGLILAYGAHMDTVADLEKLLKMCTYHAAKILRLENYGLEPGCNADMVILDAPSPSEAIVGQAGKLMIFKNGRLIAANSTNKQCLDPWNQEQIPSNIIDLLNKKERKYLKMDRSVQ